MGEEVEEFVPLLALLFKGENRDEDGQNLQVEHEVEQVLCCALLARHLEVTLLEAFEIGNAIVCQEVKAKLH